jgi:hypothetical protein
MISFTIAILSLPDPWDLARQIDEQPRDENIPTVIGLEVERRAAEFKTPGRRIYVAVEIEANCADYWLVPTISHLSLPPTVCRC